RAWLDAGPRFFSPHLFRDVVCRRADDLIHAVVVEPDRYSAGGEEHRYAVTHDERSSVIHFETASPVQLDREYAERLQLPERIQDACEVFGRHLPVLRKWNR